MEHLSTPPSRAGRDTSGGKKPRLWMLLLSLLQMGASLVAQRLKRLPPMQETQVRSLSQEDPLEKEMATHSSTLAWKILWTEKPRDMGSQRVGHG